MIQIEKNVAIPQLDKQFGVRKYPFAEMQVNDSFAVPTTPETKIRVRANIAAAAYTYANASGVKFTVRTLPGVIRVWRVA